MAPSTCGLHEGPESELGSWGRRTSVPKELRQEGDTLEKQVRMVWGGASPGPQVQ